MKKSRLFIPLLGVIVLTACQFDSNDTNSSSNASEEETSIEHVGEEMNMEEEWIIAAGNGETEELLQLLEDGMDIDAIDDQGRTAVMAATQNHQTETVNALIKQGADIDIQNHRQDNVLLYAAAEGLLDIVQLAIDAGADTSLTNRYGGTALIPAADRGHVDIVEKLLANSDVDINHINDLNWTALLEAIILGDGEGSHQTMVHLLVDHGADVNIADGDGVTPLEHAERRGFTEMEDILIDAGA